MDLVILKMKINQRPIVDQLLSSSVVGDGGASWRLKALKRAQEQAAREGRDVKEVAQERWGSLGHLAVSVASQSAAAPRAHLHAIKSRRMGRAREVKSDSNDQSKSDTVKVLVFAKVDEQLKDALCDRLRPVLCIENILLYVRVILLVRCSL